MTKPVQIWTEHKIEIRELLLYIKHYWYEWKFDTIKKIQKNE